MTFRDQEHRFGICALPHVDGDVVIKIGAEAVRLSPADARKFAYELAGAYFRAERIKEGAHATA